MAENRISKYFPQDMKPLDSVNQFFLACEFKPNSKLWYVLESFAYDVTPAFTHGKLGVLNYDPAAYAILDLNEQDELLMGYLMTITNPDGVFLLDKIKGFNGKNAFNMHLRTLTHVFTDAHKVTSSWCYVVSSQVLNVYKQIQQIEWGMWEQDEQQVKLLEKLTDSDE